MEVRATVPVRIVIDPDTAAAHLDQIDAALTDAATRALRRARTLLDTRNAEDVEQRAHPPELSWSGEGLPALDAHTRQRVESVVTTALATARSGAFPAATAAAGPPRDWLSGLDEGTDQKLFDLARIEEYLHGSRPKQIGVIFRRPGGKLAYRVWRYPSGERMLALSGNLYRSEKQVANGKLTVRDVRFVPPASATFHLRYDRAISAPAQLRRVYVDIVGAETEPGRSADLDRLASAWAARKWQDGVRWVLVLAVDGEPIVITSTIEVPRDLDADLVPITVDGSMASGLAGSSGSDGPVELAGSFMAGGTGQPATAGGEAGASPDEAAGRLLWPEAGIAGEPLVCEPFWHEPAVTRLVDDHGMRARMTALAADLGVPECGYLGTFALNCAAVITGRAWAIGLSSVDTGTRTRATFRPDGGGNNGFVDIRPGDSTELDELRRLARVAADLHAFDQGLVATYLDPRNATLICPYPGAAPNPGAWARQFDEMFNDRLANGYQYLYAETCRVLLLQQLRTSLAGIDARRSPDNINRSVAFFADTLDILGELVVQLSTLRTAIRHSRDVLVTGSVREVLSQPRIVAGAEGMPVALSPPVESVPDRILAVVGDAPITGRGDHTTVTFQNRGWTEQDLDDAIGLRRGLVNQVDPIFLHIRDLDEVFDRAQRDSTYPLRYLLDLLTGMRQANQGMTDKASNAFEGAFFALEASQYIRRQGVRGWHGLRFELQGIHLLADQVLRPAVGADPLYDEGVNAALSRKADFDDFVALFSSVGMIVLGLLCAPAGALVVAAVTAGAGIALAVHDVREADRKSDLYQALVDPELFQRWEEVQLAQVMAQLSIAFAVFDVGSVVGEAAQAAVGVARRALRGGAPAVRHEIVRTMTETVLAQAARQALTQFAITEVMNVLLPEVITPVLAAWLRDEAREHGTLPEVTAILATLADQEATPHADQ